MHGVRNLDAFFDEAFIDGGVEAVDDAAALFGVVDPAQQLEVERRVAEGSKAHARFGQAADVARAGGDGHEYAAHLVDVGAVGHAHSDADAEFLVGAAGFVDDLNRPIS